MYKFILMFAYELINKVNISYIYGDTATQIQCLSCVWLLNLSSIFQYYMCWLKYKFTAKKSLPFAIRNVTSMRSQEWPIIPKYLLSTLMDLKSNNSLNCAMAIKAVVNDAHNLVSMSVFNYQANLQRSKVSSH